MRLRPFTLGMLACALGGGASVAQELPAVEPRREFGFTGSVSTFYESNFARSSRALAVLRDIDPEEFTVRPQVDVNVVQPLGRQIVYVRGFAGYEFHLNNVRLDRARGDMQGGYVASLGICQLSAFGGYRASQSDLATLDGLRTQNRIGVQTTGAGVQCSRGSGISGMVMAQRIDTKNSADVQKTADSTAETLATQLGYGNPGLGQIGLFFSYANNEFPNQITPGRPVGDGYAAHTYAVSVERAVGSRITVNLQGGMTHVKREFAPPGQDQKFKTTTYSGQIEYRLGSRLTLNLDGSRAVVPTVRAGKLYDITQAGEFRATYRLGRRILVTAGHRIDDIESNTDTSIARPVVTTSQTNSTFGSVRYRQSDRLSFRLEAGYDDRNTNLPDFDYTSTRVGLSAEVSF